MTINLKAAASGKAGAKRIKYLAECADQIGGVLVCALAACEGADGLPLAARNAFWAAARLAQDMRRRAGQP